MLAGTILAVELISWCGLCCIYGGWSVVQTAAEGIAGPDPLGRDFDFPEEVVHPYLGFVRRPGPREGHPLRTPPVNTYGFADREPPLHLRRDGQVIIGILGGSLAEDFSNDALDILRDELAKSGCLAGRQPAFVRLALAGYKQPQQLMLVNYLLALGGQFDVLINIDGYNEIVLPAVENAPEHVFAGFPRSWQLRVTETGDLAAIRTIGRIVHIKDRARYWADLVQKRPCCYSPTANLLWRMYHASSRRALFAEYAMLNALTGADDSYAARGPPQQFPTPTALYEHCARIWMRSSLQLHLLCTANGIHYFHFLQPNQYVPESKPMGREERLLAIAPGDRGQDPVENGYPLLIREGRTLVAKGVSFSDLTRLFADHSEATYRDHCCHLNRHGSELMAGEIAKVIGRGLNARGATGPP